MKKHDLLPDLSARHLRAVLALIEYRSFIAAAAFLKVSQPALTRTIKQVEAELGATLFLRTTRQVEVTAAGREFAAVAERMLNDLRISIEHMRTHGSKHAGQIIVSSVVSLAGAVLPELVATFGRRYPGIQVHLREGIQADVVDDVRSGVADFAIGYVDDLPEGIESDALASEKFHVVTAKSHSLARRQRIPIEALKDLTLVSFPRESRSRRILDAGAARRGFTLRYAMTANRLGTLLSLVRNGIGVAVLPSSERPEPADPALTSRPLGGREFTCRLGFMRLKERELTSAAAIFLVVVRKWIREIHAASRD
jgi:DNA-binding transcriptional LysR family regulator